MGTENMGPILQGFKAKGTLQGHNLWGSAFLQYLTFCRITHLSLPPITGYGQPKGACGGYCSYMCAKRDEWTFSHSCGKMYCCIPPPKKGK